MSLGGDAARSVTVVGAVAPCLRTQNVALGLPAESMIATGTTATHTDPESGVCPS